MLNLCRKPRDVESGGDHILTEIWCIFYTNGAKTNTREKLEIIRSVVSIANSKDIAIFNHWAQKANCPEIQIDSKNLL